VIGLPDSPNPFRSCKLVGADIDPEAYHTQENGIERGDPGYVMTRSSLMAFRSCPAKWRAGWVPKETDATEYGSLQDCRVLTPERFASCYVVQPKTCLATKGMSCVKDGEAEVGDEVPWSPLSKECKAWKRDQEKNGLIVLSAAEKGESDLALGILFADRRIKTLINCSQKQVLVVGEYEDKGTNLVIPVKCLIDLVPDKDSIHGKELADLKTCRSAHPRTWLKVIDELCYDAQASICLDLYCAATGEDRTNFVHAIQENVHPWQTARRMLSVEFIQLGRMKVVEALKRYCKCLSEDRWPDFDEDSPFNGWTLCEPDQWHSVLKAA